MIEGKLPIDVEATDDRHRETVRYLGALPLTGGQRGANLEEPRP
jgi:hypothetical protein